MHWWSESNWIRSFQNCPPLLLRYCLLQGRSIEYVSGWSADCTRVDRQIKVSAVYMYYHYVLNILSLHCLCVCVWWRWWRETSYWFNSGLRPSQWELWLINSRLPANISWLYELWVAGDIITATETSWSYTPTTSAACLLVFVCSC